MTDEENADLEVEASEPILYEISYLLVPELEEGKVGDFVDGLKTFISKEEGTVSNEGTPKLIPLAYEMSKSVANKKSKYNNAHFGWLKFELPADKIQNVKNHLDVSEILIRFLIIRASKEVSQPHRPAPKRRPVARKEVKEDKGEVDEAQLDKEIEELLVS